MSNNRIPFKDAICFTSMKNLMMYSKKELEFLYYFMEDVEYNTFHVFFSKERRVQIMILTNSRNESYMYRKLAKFIRNGHIHKRKRGRYIIDPKLIYFGDIRSWYEDTKKFDSIVYTDSEAI